MHTLNQNTPAPDQCNSYAKTLTPCPLPSSEDVTLFPSDIQIKWSPSYIPQHIPNMKHVLDSISPTSLENIKAFCRFPPSTQIVKLSRNQQIHITTHELRQLVSHGKPISHSPIVLMLDLLCHRNGFSYVNSSFSVFLIQGSWQYTKNHFAGRRQRKLDRPDLVLDPIIAIPIFINNCHWVAVCCQIINNCIKVFLCR